MAQDDLGADAPDDAVVIKYAIVVVSPDLHPAFDTSLGVRFAGKAYGRACYAR